MVGSFLTRGLVMVFGYAYPAYECFKTVEKNKPEIEQLLFWCQYWILVALLTVFEKVGDTFISWVPMYSEAKLAFFIYLWYPKTKGTTYVYDSFFRPYLAKHETEIDRNLLELRARAGDIIFMYWQKAARYGQTSVFEILQYFASQSTSRPRPSQQQQQGARARQPPATGPTNLPTATLQQQRPQQPPSRTSSTASTKASTEEQHEPAQEVGPSLVPPAPPASGQPQTASTGQPAAEATNQSPTTEEAMQVEPEPVPSLANENAKPKSQEEILDEAKRVTRGRLRKTRSASNR